MINFFFRVLPIVGLIFPLSLHYFLVNHDLNVKSFWGDEISSIAAATGQTRIFPFDPKNFSPDDLKKPWIADLGINLLQGHVTPNDIWNKNKISNLYSTTLQYENGNSFLYNISLHFWIIFNPVDEVSLAKLGIAFSLISLVIVYYIVFYLTKKSFPAVISSSMLAVAPFFIHYAREIRSYSMACCFLLIGTLNLLRFYYDHKGKKEKKISVLNYLSFLIPFLISFLSHFNVIYILLSFAFFLVIAIFRKKIDIGYSALIAVSIVIFPILLMLYTGVWDGLRLMNGYGLNWLRRAKEAIPSQEIINWSDTFAYAWSSLTWNWNLWDALFIDGKDVLNGTVPEENIKHFIIILIMTSCLSGILLLSIFSKMKKEIFLLFFLLVTAGTMYGVFLSKSNGHPIPLLNKYGIFSAVFYPVLIGYLLGSYKRQILSLYTNGSMLFLRLNLIFFWKEKFKFILTLILAFYYFYSAFYSLELYYYNNRVAYKENAYKSASKQMIRLSEEKGIFVFNASDKLVYVNLFLRNYPLISQKIDLNQKESIVFQKENKERIIVVSEGREDFY